MVRYGKPVKHNIVRDFIFKGYVIEDHARTDENLDYPLMKGLVRKKIQTTSKRTILLPPYQ